ncbi:MAG TPA: DUF1214 domain-containing protein [Roseiarcus sp.]|nr:DUF1214 domain-containing protein [Roseiarcus sp.]
MIGLIKALAVAVAGLALGLWATRAALTGALPIAVDSLGQWRVEARAGAADADPYTRARIERSGEIALALGEGLRLTTRLDSEGRTLDGACVYKLGRQAPTARYWTLEAIDGSGFPLENAAGRYVLRSTELLRDPDGGFAIWISPSPHAGNWLPVAARGRFGLALRLYDPALSDAAVGFERATAPSVVRTACG